MTNFLENPTDLEIFYCEHCHGIIASSDLSAVPETDNSNCPFCNEPSLVKLAKEDYKNNFSIDLFPYPQNILLWNFFEFSDSTLSLLNRFSRLSVLSALRGQLDGVSEIPKTHILVPPELLITVFLEVSSDYEIRLKSKNRADMTALFA